MLAGIWVIILLGMTFTPPQSTREYLQRLVGQRLILRHYAGISNPNAKEKDVISKKGGCDEAVEVVNIAFGNSSLQLRLRNIGSPTVRHKNTACTISPDVYSFKVTDFDLAQPIDEAENAIGHLLQTPEAYLVAYGIPWDLPPSSENESPVEFPHPGLRPPEVLLSIQPYYSDENLALTCLFAGITPIFFQGNQAEIEQQKSPPGDSIRETVRRNLSEDVDEEDGARNLFLLGDEAVPSLIEFLSDSDKAIRAGAARGLAYIGNQRGMQALRVAVKAERDAETKSAISCFLAGGLVETKSESDLHFLRSSVEGAHFSDDDEKDFSAFCAALALGMMGRSDSLPILRKAAGADLLDSEEIGKAILWMDNKSASKQGTTGPAANDEERIKSVVLDHTFFAARERDKTSVENIKFNRARTKALVSLEIYLNPKSARGYDLVLSKEGRAWRVVGIWFAWVA